MDEQLNLKNSVTQSLEKYIFDYTQLEPSNGFLIACSGGVDSIVLLHLIVNILKEKKDLGICIPKLHVVYCDHGLRENAYEKDSAPILAIQKDFDFNFISFKLKLSETKTHESLEMKSRDERYQAITNYMSLHELRVCFLAHHANDVTETSIMQLMRGAKSQLTGIRELSSKNGQTFLRPLLSVPKSQLISYANKQSLSYSEDESNQDTRYLRNKIRQTIVPHIEAAFPNCHQKITDFLNYQEENRVFLMSLIKDYLPIEDQCESEFLIEKKSILSLAPFLQSFWAQAILKHYYKTGYSEDHVTQIVNYLSKTEFHCYSLPKGYSVFSDKRYFLMTKKETVDYDYEYVLNKFNGSLEIDELKQCFLLEPYLKEILKESQIVVRPFCSKISQKALYGKEKLLQKLFKKYQFSKIEKTRYPVLFANEIVIAVGNVWKLESFELKYSQKS